MSEVDYKIGFAGTDARTLISALVTSTATSEFNPDEKFQGTVVRGNRAMEEFARIMDWPVRVIPTTDNTAQAYADVLIEELKNGNLDYALIMPEDLLYQGVVDKIAKAGFSSRIIGLNSDTAVKIEGNKIAGKELSRKAGVPVADEWEAVNARNYKEVLSVCLRYIDKYGGAYLKFPFSAQGKGSRPVSNVWEVKNVYRQLIDDYQNKYKEICQKNYWPLLIESWMSGIEISLTVLVDEKGNFQILPPAMDYPERFIGPSGPNNPITGGMGAISPHPLGTPEVVEMAKKTIIEPFVGQLKKENLLRPCVLYPGCFLSLDKNLKPTRIRVSEWNVRPGEPEFQVVARRVRNLGALLRATSIGALDRIEPEIRSDQIALTIAIVTGPGGPQGQKGYPWSCTIGENIEIDFDYFKKKKITLVPSAIEYDGSDKTFQGGGSRPAFLLANITAGKKQTRKDAVESLRNKLLAAFKENKIRMIPREDPKGNRFDLRPDIGKHYSKTDQIFLF